MKFDYKTEFFLQELEACYFPPERWVSGFPSETILLKTRCAMLLLWQTTEIEIFGSTYSEERIKKYLLEKMTPSHVDSAINMYLSSAKLHTVYELAEMIFFFVAYESNEETAAEQLCESRGAE